MRITKLLGNLFAVVSLSIIATGCWILGDPNDPLVLTTSDNVNPEAVGTDEAISIPLAELKQEVRDLFGEDVEIVLTSESNVLGLPGAISIRLSSDVTKDLLSEGVLSGLMGTAGAIYPPILPFLPLLGLLSRRWRRLGKSAVKNLLPGTVGSGGKTSMQPIEAFMDLAKFVGSMDSRPEPATEGDEDVRVVLEG